MRKRCCCVCLRPQWTLRAAFIPLLALWCIAPSIAQAQSPSNVSDDVSNYVRSEMQRQHIPGVALLVSRGGKIVQAEGFGLANVELQVPVKPETVFQSGSVGKQFTATAVMMLVEEGKVALDDPLTKYFPGAPPSWKGVTVRELLSHTAGFGDYPENLISARTGRKTRS
jgi:CubicO group peptidase (beta-lactamase class C family)